MLPILFPSVFDKLGEGWIMSADLRDVMKHLGERLSDIEVDDMLKEADRENNGRVFYQGMSFSHQPNPKLFFWVLDVDVHNKHVW